MKAILYIVCFFTIQAQSYATFLNYEKLPTKWKEVATDIRKSVVKFNVIGSGTCTGTVISDEGHVLTAMHCFHNCLKDAKAYQVHKLQNEQRTDYYVTLKKNKLPLCHIRFKDYSFEEEDDLNSQMDIDTADIIAAGSGKILLNPNDPQIDTVFDFYQANQNDFFSLRQKGIGRILGDFVIFQSDSYKSKPCSSISQQELTPKTKLLSISYPFYTYSRRDGVNPNGRSQYMSLGTVSETGILASDSNSIETLINEYGRNEVARAYNFNQDIFWSDIDINIGSSGSPVYNESGSIIGLTTYNTCNAQAAMTTGCNFSTGGIALRRILADLKLNYSKEKVEKVFSCRK